MVSWEVTCPFYGTEERLQLGIEETAIDILVVDDEPHIARALSFILTRDGFRVAVASDGETALEMLKSCTPKIIFLDLMLPKISGYEVCETIKNDDRLKHAHVVILTCKGQELDKQRSMSAGADEYLTKPFSPKEVLVRTRELLNK